MEKWRAQYRRHKELILYVMFGGFTTLINLVVYYICRRIRMDVVPADVIAWFLSVLFAYVTNKLYVFESRSWKLQLVLREGLAFFAARVVSLGVDVAFLYVTVEMLGWWDMPMKLAANVIVIVLNYVFSKLIIFRKEKAAQQPKG